MGETPAFDPKGLELAVKVSLLSYSSIHPTRAHVVNHLYCVNGNGYEWFEGRLYDGTDELSTAVEKMLQNGDPETWIKKYVEEQDRKRFPGLHEMEETLEKLRKLDLKYNMPALPPPERPKLHIYPICQYADIMNLPEDIRPDWLAGAEEALHLIETVPSSDEARTRENRKKWVPQIRDLIRKRKEGK